MYVCVCVCECGDVERVLYIEEQPFFPCLNCSTFTSTQDSG